MPSFCHSACFLTSLILNLFTQQIFVNHSTFSLVNHSIFLLINSTFSLVNYSIFLLNKFLSITLPFLLYIPKLFCLFTYPFIRKLFYLFNKYIFASALCLFFLYTRHLLTLPSSVTHSTFSVFTLVSYSLCNKFSSVTPPFFLYIRQLFCLWSITLPFLSFVFAFDYTYRYCFFIC